MRDATSQPFQAVRLQFVGNSITHPVASDLFVRTILTEQKEYIKQAVTTLEGPARFRWEDCPDNLRVGEGGAVDSRDTSFNGAISTSLSSCSCSCSCSCFLECNAMIWMHSKVTIVPIDTVRSKCSVTGINGSSVVLIIDTSSRLHFCYRHCRVQT